MVECAKCGRDNQQGLVGCPDCGWPLTIEAWRGCQHRVRRVTIDTNCVNQRQKDEALNTLERWAVEGKLVIERAPAMLIELKGPLRIAKARTLVPHCPPWVLGESQLGIDTNVAGPDMGPVLADVLFPTTHTLNANQMADIEHLRSHIQTGADVFLTQDAGDFIAVGKQLELRSFGIWVFNPSELVTLCREVYLWP